MYNLVFTKQATQFLRRLSRNEAQRLRENLEQLAIDPASLQNNITPLRGRPGYRLRVGDWRVLYEQKEDLLVILVLKIGARGDVYR